MAGTEQTTGLRIGREQLRALWPVVLIDLLSPIGVYYLFHALGATTVWALIWSGFPPAIRIVMGITHQRKLDVIGAFVLGGILVGSVAGGLTDDAHLVLLDGVVPTVAFGAICLTSLLAHRPLIYRFALEVLGETTALGRALEAHFALGRLRRSFQAMTLVWGLAYLAEAAAQLAIIELASAGAAKTSGNLLPVVFTLTLACWNFVYGRRVLNRNGKGGLLGLLAQTPAAPG